MSHHEPIDFTFDSPQETGYKQNTGGSSGNGEGIWAAIIGAVVDFFEGIFNRRAQRRENEKDRKFNAEQAELNRQWQEEQYKKYESVVAQMQQRQAAGLNPNDQIQAMSVGSGSSASSSSHSLPPMDFSLFAQLPAMFAGLKKTQAETENIKQNTVNARVDGMRKAVELDDFMSFREYYLEGVKHDTNKKQFDAKKAEEDAKKAFDEARLAHIKANEAEDAYNAGVNQIVDGHNLTEAQLQHYMKQKEEIDARIRNLNIDFDAKQFALNLSKIYDEQFLKLDLSARETEVNEFLDTSEVRVALYNVQKAFAKLAVDEATRQDALAKIQNKYELHIAQQILNSAEDGDSSFDAVLLKYFCENPGSTLSALASLGASFRPNISNSNTTRYDTGAHFTTINN